MGGQPPWLTLFPRERASVLTGVTQWVAHCPADGKVDRFLVRTYAWAAGQVPSRGRARQLIGVSHRDVTLPLSPSLPLFLNK